MDGMNEEQAGYKQQPNRRNEKNMNNAAACNTVRLPKWSVVSFNDTDMSVKQGTVLDSSVDTITMWSNGRITEMLIEPDDEWFNVVDEQSEMPWNARVLQWCEDRNLIKGSNPAKQYGKLLEEMAELYTAADVGDCEGVKDGIGDCYVVLACMCGQIECEVPTWKMGTKLDMPHCLNNAIALIADLPTGPQWRSRESFGYPCQSVCIALEHVAIAHELTKEECMEHAWNEICFRRGYTDPRTGLFVKNADMPEELKEWMSQVE